IVAALQAMAPELLPRDAVLRPDDVAPTRLEALPPPEEIDWAVLVEGDAVLHVECQGYRGPGFDARLFWYRLALALRHRPRRVETVALWLLVPPAAQRPDAVEINAIRVRVTPVV